MILFALLGVLLILPPTNAPMYEHNCRLVPPNKINIPIEGTAGIDEGTFKQVLADVMSIYAPIVKQAGGVLVLNNKWDDTTVNSDTSESGKTWTINAYGGLARYNNMNYDSYLLVICHEIGHHLGGFPKYKSSGRWASNEGQADYFATSKCFREMLSDSADTRHRSEDASLILANVLRELGNEPAISIDTPDKKEVKQTDDSHPAAQCRLDTYINGSKCYKSYKEPFSNKDPKPGACTEEAGDEVGFRPRCWYKPQ